MRSSLQDQGAGGCGSDKQQEEKKGAGAGGPAADAPRRCGGEEGAHAEVGDARVARAVEQDVRGLDVAVHDAALVQVDEAEQHLGGEEARLGLGEGAALVQQVVLEVAARLEVERKEHLWGGRSAGVPPARPPLPRASLFRARPPLHPSGRRA